MTAQIIWTEIKLLTREPLVLVVSLLFPILLMVLLLASFNADPEPVLDNIAGTDFYLLSYLAAAVAVMGFMGTPTHLASYRQNGVLRRFSAAGVPASALVVAQLVVLAALAVVCAAIMIPLAYAGFDLAEPVSVGGAAAGFGLGILAFAAIGTLLGSLLPTPRGAQGLGLLLFFGTFFVAGGGPPPTLLPDALNNAADVTPVGLLINAIRSPWTGQGLDVPAMAGLAGIAVVGFALAIRRLGRSGG